MSQYNARKSVVLLGYEKHYWFRSVRALYLGQIMIKNPSNILSLQQLSIERQKDDSCFRVENFLLPAMYLHIVLPVVVVFQDLRVMSGQLFGSPETFYFQIHFVHYNKYCLIMQLFVRIIYLKPLSQTVHRIIFLIFCIHS